MPQRKIHSVNKALTEEERVRHRVIREQVEQESGIDCLRAAGEGPAYKAEGSRCDPQDHP
jgi:hypothetical protein